ncbi:hypothetical protein [Chryseobacterium sp. MA9]|uniref:hypothetical protein n=1 Tax=Chryseobacterium sp. MA9 TaxID=2966625 RepID=UPI0021068C28|nr:hypothetical protein [Chryseobacterium sp. MA9]UTX48856.1 hypothetical protein KIK00_00880 [Chryseobacterium sp. MA9]
MNINKIKNRLAEKLSNDCSTWHDVLNNTQPKDFVCNHWKVDISPTDIEIDIPNGVFLVNDGFFSTSGTLLELDNENIFYNKAFTAKGKFNLDNASNLKMEEIKIEIEIDIF